VSRGEEEVAHLRVEPVRTLGKEGIQALVEGIDPCADVPFTKELAYSSPGAGRRSIGELHECGVQTRDRRLVIVRVGVAAENSLERAWRPAKLPMLEALGKGLFVGKRRAAL
jgi:hypothetical protein